MISYTDVIYMTNKKVVEEDLYTLFDLTYREDDEPVTYDELYTHANFIMLTAIYHYHQDYITEEIVQGISEKLEAYLDGEEYGVPAIQMLKKMNQEILHDTLQLIIDENKNELATLTYQIEATL